MGKTKLNKQVKYIGVILRYDFRWNSHLSNLEKTEPRNKIQNNKLFQRISRLQEKALHIISFKQHNTPSDLLVKKKQNLKNIKFHQIQKYRIC